MKESKNAEVGCLYVGDYVDEAECPTDSMPLGGVVVRPQVVANCLDVWGRDDNLREFTVLLKDGRTAAIRGHGLKHEPHPLAGEDVFIIIVRTATDEVPVALFKTADIAGIFHGDLRVDRKTA